MVCNALIIAGIEIPCDAPIFLAILAIHIPFGESMEMLGETAKVR